MKENIELTKQQKIIIGIIMFFLGMISPIIMILIREGLFNPYILLLITIPLYTYLRIKRYKREK